MNGLPARTCQKIAACLAILIVVLAIGGCDRPPAISELGPQDTIVAFGDSLTWGTGAPREAAYPQRLENLIGIEVVNAGVPGELSGEGRRRLPGVLAEYDPQLVILCHGGNDMLRRRSLERLEENLRFMIETCRNAGAEVVLVGVPRPGFTLEPPQLYADLAREYDLPYAGDVLGDLLSDRDFKSDNIHPNAAGYRELARVLADLLAEAQSP